MLRSVKELRGYRIQAVDGTAGINVGAEAVEQSPEFDPSAPVNREYEVRLYDYYGRPKYWTPI